MVKKRAARATRHSAAKRKGWKGSQGRKDARTGHKEAARKTGNTTYSPVHRAGPGKTRK
jgi:hypothetical protein